MLVNSPTPPNTPITTFQQAITFQTTPLTYTTTTLTNSNNRVIPSLKITNVSNAKESTPESDIITSPTTPHDKSNKKTLLSRQMSTETQRNASTSTLVNTNVNKNIKTPSLSETNIITNPSNGVEKRNYIPAASETTTANSDKTSRSNRRRHVSSSSVGE